MDISKTLSNLLGSYWFEFFISYDFVALLLELGLLAYLIPKIILWREQKRLEPVRNQILFQSNIYVLSLGAKVQTVVLKIQNIIDVLEAENYIQSDSIPHPKIKSLKRNALRELSQQKKSVLQEAKKLKQDIESIRLDVDRLEATISSFSHVIDSKKAERYVALIGQSHLLAAMLANAVNEWQLDALGPQDLADLSKSLDSIEDTGKRVLDVIRGLKT